jgi:hypothetical protein
MNTFNEIFYYFIDLILKKIKDLFELEYLRLYEDNEIDNIKQDHNSLLNLKNDIYKLYEEIKFFDNEIIKICEAINQAYKTHNKKENKYKEFKAYFKINSSINKYIEELMIVNVGNKQPIKDKFIKDVKKYDNLNLFRFDTEKNIVSITLMLSPQIKPNNSPKIEEFNESQNSESIELIDDPDKKLQCNIVLILTEQLTEQNNLNPYLIAIFNYGIYKKKLDIIFRRLIGIYDYIKKKSKKENSIINTLIQDINPLIININYSNFNLEEIENSIYINKKKKICSYTLNTYNNIYYYYKYYKYKYLLSEIYKYYIQTLGKSKFLNNINEYLMNKNGNHITKAGWDLNIIIKVINRLKIIDVLTNDNFINFLNEYLLEEEINNKLNFEIINKIFSKIISDFDPLYIKYRNFNGTYDDLMSTTLNFNFYTNSKDNDKYIRIMKDSENNYINIFGEP